MSGFRTPNPTLSRQIQNIFVVCLKRNLYKWLNTLFTSRLLLEDLIYKRKANFTYTSKDKCAIFFNYNLFAQRTFPLEKYLTLLANLPTQVLYIKYTQIDMRINQTRRTLRG